MFSKIRKWKKNYVKEEKKWKINENYKMLFLNKVIIRKENN